MSALIILALTLFGGLFLIGLGLVCLGFWAVREDDTTEEDWGL